MERRREKKKSREDDEEEEVDKRSPMEEKEGKATRIHSTEGNVI